MKILIAEDEKNTRNALAECVRGFGFGFEKILLAQNGRQAFALFEKERPEIVITDIRMPGGSGTELAERIYRKDGNTAIIFLTAYSELELMKEAIHVSAVDYILKPVSPSELELAIRRAMEKTNSFARKNTALLQEIFFRNLLLDGQRYSGKEYRQIQRELGLPDEKLRYALIVIENLNQEKERTEMDPEYAAFDMTPLGKIIRRGLERFPFCYSLVHREDRILAVCGMREGTAQEELEEAASRLGAMIYETCFEKATIWVGKIEEELFWLRDDASLYRKIEPAYTIPKISDKKSITAKDQMIVEKIRRIIAADYGDPELKVNDMADHLCYTSAYLCMVYKKVTGMTINDSLNLYRIGKSRQLLKDSSLKMAEIAAKVGYSNENYFSKVFKKYEGISPKEYRTKRWDG
ncbi:MAG TPA: response regulator [Candidatus Eisenbergiella pullicola]|nr:response regulator [Candidatus Eisenbergiella pullicola]